MKTPREKYMYDPEYHCLVQMLESFIARAQFTPSELREAVVLACINYEGRTYVGKEKGMVPVPKCQLVWGVVDALGWYGLDAAQEMRDTISPFWPGLDNQLREVAENLLQIAPVTNGHDSKELPCSPVATESSTPASAGKEAK